MKFLVQGGGNNGAGTVMGGKSKTDPVKAPKQRLRTVISASNASSILLCGLLQFTN
jgi:hypothetical protein